jgi:hypothetical protein
LGDNPDQLPILQHALMRTWSYWTRFKDYEDELVDLKHYEAIGTMAEALSMHANEAYDELEDDQKRICEVLFKAITEKRGENFGIRRPTRLNEIASIADVSEEEVIAVIDKFREPGRSLLTPSFGTAIQSKGMIDISHESLMRIWTRLKNWVDDEADAVTMYLRLAEAASQYQVGKSGLWRPPDLQLALNWQAKHKPTLVWGQRYHPAFERTMIFLEYSKKEFETEQRIKELEQKRKLRNARIVAIVLGTATVVSLMFLVFAFYQQTLAERARKEAVANAEAAVKASEEAKKQRAEAEKQRDEADKARQDALAQKALADKANAEAQIQKAAAEASAERAIREEKRAIAAADLAKRKEAEATASEKVAKEQEAKANQERFLALAKSMALKSKELSYNPELEALVAQQAYIYNTKWDGYKYEDAIYNGLYKALRNQVDKNGQPAPHPLTKNLEGHDRGAARAMVTHAKAKKIYSGGSDGRIFEWTFNGGGWKAGEIKPKSDYQYFCLDVTPDENLMIAGGMAFGDGTKNYLELYDLRNPGVAPKKIPGFTGYVEHIEITPDSKGAYVRDNSGHSIKYTDFNTVREVISSKIKINAFSLSPDGTRIAGAGEDGVLYVWSTTDFKSKEVFKNSDPLTALTYSPNGQRIVAGDQDGLVWVVNESNGQATVLSGHRAHIEQIKFNFEGSFVATASRDHTVRLWNWKFPNKQPIVFEDNPDWVWCATFTPDDEQLLVGVHSQLSSIKETIHAWPTKITTMSGLLCGIVTRNMTEDEWLSNVDDTGAIKPEKTCEALPANKK